MYNKLVMQDIYQTFEFDRIKEFILEYAKTEVGKRMTLSLLMYEDVKEVVNALEDLKEVMSIILRFGPFPISTSADALKLMEMAKKTGILSPHDLYMLANDVETSNALIDYMKKVDVSSYPRIKDKISSFNDLSSLYQLIRRVITSSLTVDDKASDKLHEIRTSLKKLMRQLEGKAASLAYTYASYLSDDNPTIRDGHFVLPVKTAYKAKVLGAVYDVSDTGNTTFIEPLEIISLNNEITSLKVEENEEVRRILKELTNACLLQEDEIIHNNAIIGELDFIEAKALYAKNSNSEVASINLKNQIIDLKEARHPLLDASKVVANSYHFDEEKRIVIISGPNAGGKTVSLKTVGLLVLMNQAGLALPVQKAELSYFNHIYIDIGDNQSISDNLSTFSAHMSHVGEITKIAKGKDLILMDELGTGTDPKEGEAIAIGVIKSLIRAHSFAFVSSHFSSLKEFALTHPNIENSSMIFDEEKLVPTYHFKMGVPGKSYGLDVASRYGIKEEIIQEAKTFLENNNSYQNDKLMEVLQKKIEETTRLENELKIEKARLEAENKRLTVDQKNLEEKRKKLLESVEGEKERLLQEAKDKIEEIMKMLSSGDVKLHDVIELKHRIEELEEDETVETFDDDIAVNDRVEVPSLSLEGIVKRIKGNKATVFTNSGISLEIELNRLHKVHKEMNKGVSKTKVHTEIDLRSVPIELNIIGLHVDEAYEKVVKYIDDCRIKHMARVRIIHGFGSGALRRMVHEYLSKQKDLTYSLAEGHEGGGGATVVKFNDR